MQKQRRAAKPNQASQSVESISTSYSISDTPKSNDSLNISSSGVNNFSSVSLHVSDIDLSLNSNLSRLGTSSDSLGELNIKSSGSFGNLKLSSESIQQSVSEAQGSLSRNGSDLLTIGRSTQSQGPARVFSESISSESQPEFNAKYVWIRSFESVNYLVNAFVILGCFLKPLMLKKKNQYVLERYLIYKRKLQRKLIHRMNDRQNDAKSIKIHMKRLKKISNKSLRIKASLRW